MNKFIVFLLFAFSVIGAMGGLIVTILYGRYETSLGIVALAITAWPKFKQYWYTLNFK
jgi:hypothetical protein